MLLFAHPSFFILILCSVAYTQQKESTNDPEHQIRSLLAKSIRKCELKLAGAKVNLLVAFTDESLKIKGDKTLDVQVKIQVIETLVKEKQAFDTTEKLPKSSCMIPHVELFNDAVSSARKECSKAFDEAAESMLEIDLVKAKDILKEKEKFLTSSLLNPMPEPKKTIRTVVVSEPKPEQKDSRIFWRFAADFGGGHFKLLLNGKWQEIGKDGALIATWTETSRTEDYIQLDDSERGYKIRLGNGKAWMAAGENGTFTPSPHGNWEK